MGKPLNEDSSFIVTSRSPDDPTWALDDLVTCEKHVVGGDIGCFDYGVSPSRVLGVLCRDSLTTRNSSDYLPPLVWAEWRWLSSEDAAYSSSCAVLAGTLSLTEGSRKSLLLFDREANLLVWACICSFDFDLFIK